MTPDPALAAWYRGEWSAEDAPPALDRPRLIAKYPGSKARLAGLIAALCPQARVWLEAFAGTGIVTLSRSPSSVEILNDACGHVCNLFRVLRDPNLREALARQIDLTPYSREEYLKAPVRPEETKKIDPVEWARRFLVVCWQGFGSRQLVTEGWKRDVKGITTPNTARWNLVSDRILAVADRLKLVEIENTDALDLLPEYAHPWVSLYLDPPYPRTTRKESLYRFEMDGEGHRRLLDLLLAHPGPCVVSSYANPLYNDALADWERLCLRAYSQRGAARQEIIWRNLPAVQLAPIHSLPPAMLKTLRRLRIAPGDQLPLSNLLPGEENPDS